MFLLEFILRYPNAFIRLVDVGPCGPAAVVHFFSLVNRPYTHCRSENRQAILRAATVVLWRHCNPTRVVRLPAAPENAKSDRLAGRPCTRLRDTVSGREQKTRSRVRTPVFRTLSWPFFPRRRFSKTLTRAAPDTRNGFANSQRRTTVSYDIRLTSPPDLFAFYRPECECGLLLSIVVGDNDSTTQTRGRGAVRTRSDGLFSPRRFFERARFTNPRGLVTSRAKRSNGTIPTAQDDFSYGCGLQWLLCRFRRAEIPIAFLARNDKKTTLSYLYRANKSSEFFTEIA